MSLKQLKNLDVETLSGTTLGHVHDLVLQTDGQMLAQYVVKSSMIGGKEYLISRDQVVRFEEKKLIVDDTVSSGVAGKKISGSRLRVSPDPVVMRESTDT